MPGRDPFLIAKEYLQAGELLQVRKNALTALAALDDAKSRAQLAEVALTESDAEIREKAEEEIASMPPESAREVLKLVLDKLSVPKHERGAYALLGKLRNRGMSFEFPHMPITRRVRLAKSMRDHLHPKRGVKFHFRTFGGTVVGVFLTWLLVIVYCYEALKVDLDGWSIVGYGFMGWMLTMAIAACSTQFTSPARLHADLKGGALLDIVMVALTCLGAAVIPVVLSVVGEKEGPRWQPQYLLLFAAPLMAAAVRVGTLAVFGWARSKWSNRLIQVAVGGSCGLAIYDLALMVTGYTDNHFLGLAWTMIVLCSYGLAAAFAWIDSGSVALPVSSRFERAAALGLTSVLMLLAIFILIPLSTRNDLGAISAPGPQQIDLREVPPYRGASITFRTDSSFWMSKPILEPKDNGNFASHLLLLQEGKSDKEETLPSSLAPGTYKILVENSSRENVNIFDALPKVVNRLSWAQLESRVLRRSLPVLVSVKWSFDYTFSLVFSPPTPIRPGQAAKYTVTLQPGDGYKAAVSVKCYYYGLNCIVVPDSLSTAEPTGTATVTKTDSMREGTYNLRFTGTGPVLNSPDVLQTSTYLVPLTVKAETN